MKFKNSCFCIISILSGVIITTANAENIKISILNNTIKDTVPLTIYDAQIKLDKSNNWASIGDIRPGNNLINIDSTKNNIPGLLKGKLFNGKEIVTSFNKDNDGATVCIEIKNNPHLNNPQAINSKNVTTKTANEIDDQFISISKQAPNIITETPIVLKSIASSSAGCYGGQVAFGGLFCSANSTPGVAYKSTIDGGVGYFISGGTMNFNVEPKDLIDRPITANGGGFFYVHIDFWDQITGEKVAYYDGGGLVAGGFTSVGYFRAN